MARRKAQAPPPSRAAKPKAAKAPKRGSSMIKRLFMLLVLGGLGYAAFTIPIEGRTAARRAYDGAPAARELGFTYAPLQETLRRALAWSVENGHVRPSPAHP